MAGGSRINGFLPFITMVIVQFGYAGMNIMSKVVMDSGMEPLVLVAYRQIFATIALLPFAYFMERKTRPKITKFILFQIFICSFFGATLNQVFYFLGLKNSTATISCALSNILPAVTFLLAVPFGLEVVGIKKLTGQAKVIGTLVCVSGAMLLSFYHGHVIGIGRSKIEWKYAREFQDGGAGGRHPHGGSPIASFFSGPFLLLASNVSWAIWFIVQAKMGESFQAPYTSSALMCLMSSIQCVLVALVPNHTLEAWSLKSRIRLFASMYAGFVGSALGFSLMSWTIQRRGPLYVSVFSPLLLVIVAILSWALLKEELFVGTAVGSFLIIFGLYAVLWGKSKETAEAERSKIDVMVPEPNGRLQPGQLIDLELQQPPASPQPKSHMYA